MIDSDKKKFEGVVYRYTLTAPGNDEDGFVYVGATRDEKHRRENWRKVNNKNYGGRKIQEARAKYGVGDDVWKYEVLERMEDDDRKVLKKRLEEREGYYIEQYNPRTFNSNDGGDGCGGHDAESRARISANHRHYQSAETREKLSAIGKGRKRTAETKAKISAGKKGKKRTPEQIKRQSERMKGIVPVKATEAAKEWVKQNGGGYWGNHQLPESARKNMKEAQQKRGTKVIAHYPDGTTKRFNTMLDAKKELDVKVGSIHNNLRHSSPDYKTQTGYWFEKVEGGQIDG